MKALEYRQGSWTGVMRIAIGADGLWRISNLINYVLDYLEEKGYEVKLCGDIRVRGIDYVEAAIEVAEAVRSGECDQGIIFCGTGTGISITANKVPGIRCALCSDAFDAMVARRVNGANIIAMSIRRTSDVIAREILDVWFTTEFAKEFNLEKVGLITKEWILKTSKQIDDVEKKYAGR